MVYVYREISKYSNVLQLGKLDEVIESIILVSQLLGKFEILKIVSWVGKSLCDELEMNLTPRNIETHFTM